MVKKRTASDSTSEPPIKRSGGADLNADEANIGGDVTGRDKNVTTIQGNVIYLENPSSEVVAQLLKVGLISTEVSRGSAAGIEGSKTTSEASPAPDQGTIQRIDATLQLFKQSEAQGFAAQEFQAGEVRISQVDLLLKKAILLESEADEMMFTTIRQNKSKLDQPAGSLVQVDLNNLMAGFDAGAHSAKLKEAYRLLQEANQIDPTQTEVLLHLAQLLIQLTPDDPTDEQRILFRVQKLLSSPKNDDEQFQLAQATFLLATSGDQIQAEPLRQARSMFEKLGRAEWVRQCDDLLAAPVQSPINSPMPVPAMQSLAVFQPIGRWQIRATDAAGSIIYVDIYPNGGCQGVQQAPAVGLNSPFIGQWAFIPYNQQLQFQGMVNGIYPFAFGIVIHGQQGNGYYGVGTDGLGYFLTREG
ncbi:MAG TPA: tetratricopeptide repeat protein [Anaerolineae bacterium]|nr:tetratricopeptide repeat protein [Anaerolineae bacterium]